MPMLGHSGCGCHMTPEQEQRFWAKVVRTGSCWLWTAAKNSRGYGQFAIDGASKSAHRLAYESHAGQSVPDGLTIDHLCNTKLCVNPAHLEAVTARENTLRAVADGLNPRHHVTACPKGHPYDEDNTIVKDGTRFCRTCRNAARRKGAKA